MPHETRAEIHEAFVARFHVGAPPKPFSEAELDSIEAAFDTKLPDAYRQFVTRFGPVTTPGLLSAVVELDSDLGDITQFLSAANAIESTKAWRESSMGIPEAMIGVATDCVGNLIGFRRSTKRRDDAPVVYFDHDFVSVTKLAPSFDRFLATYLRKLPPS